jgi:hypothetical protein
MLAAAVAVVAGLPFHLLSLIAQLQDVRGPHRYSAGSGWYVVAVTVGVVLLQYIPYFRYKEVPVLHANLSASPARKPSSGEDSKQPSREHETVNT